MNDCRALYCKNKNCSRPIPLPLPIHHGTSLHQVLWPRDEKPRNFLCRHCGHVYEYTFQDVRDCSDDAMAQGQGWDEDTVYRIDGLCAKENCGSHVYTLVPAHSQFDKRIIMYRWFANPTFVSAKCTSGHLTGVQAGSITCDKDPDWEWMD